jgi:hypothetical protein
MVYFQTKDPNLGTFYIGGLRMEDVGIFYIWPFGILCADYIVYFAPFRLLYPEKCGNPANTKCFCCMKTQSSCQRSFRCQASNGQGVLAVTQLNCKKVAK